MNMNSRFDAQLQTLRQTLGDMTALDLDCLREIALALETREAIALQKVLALAPEIDRAERDIETLCLRILLQRHPVASDLRRVSGTLKMVTDLQRIGHQCCDFAEILLKIGPDAGGHVLMLTGLVGQVIAMFEADVTACAHDDGAAAQRVIQSDNAVDAAYASLRTRLAEEIRTQARPLSDSLLDVLMLGKYLERMADHIVIFARWVVFTATGERPLSGEGGADS